MTKEKISEFKLRITESNRTQLIVVLYEIYFSYVNDALDFLKNMTEERTKEQNDDYVKSIRMASMVLRHLKEDLDFSYEISGELYSLYDFCERKLAKAGYLFSKEVLEETLSVMKPLYESFQEVAKEDTSSPMMQHTQKISAGYTYGRHDVTESVAMESNRGFFA